MCRQLDWTADEHARRVPDKAITWCWQPYGPSTEGVVVAHTHHAPTTWAGVLPPGLPEVPPQQLPQLPGQRLQLTLHTTEHAGVSAGVLGTQHLHRTRGPTRGWNGRITLTLLSDTAEVRWQAGQGHAWLMVRELARTMSKPRHCLRAGPRRELAMPLNTSCSHTSAMSCRLSLTCMYSPP